MTELNAFVSPARIEEALKKYHCERCRNLHPDGTCDGRTGPLWMLAEVLDYELRCAPTKSEAVL